MLSYCVPLLAILLVVTETPRRTVNDWSTFSPAFRGTTNFTTPSRSKNYPTEIGVIGACPAPRWTVWVWRMILNGPPTAALAAVLTLLWPGPWHPDYLRTITTRETETVSGHSPAQSPSQITPNKKDTNRSCRICPSWLFVFSNFFIV